MSAMSEIQRGRFAWIPIRECLLMMLHVLPAAAASASSASFAACGSLLQECAHWAVHCLLPKNCWLQQEEVSVAVAQQHASNFLPWSAALIFSESTGAADRVCMLAEAVRREYGGSTDWFYPQHPQHMWNMKSLSKLGCGYSTHTVQIPRGSRRIEHPPRSAASVRKGVFPVPIWPILCWWDVKPYSINQTNL